MSLDELHRNWEELAREDPLYSILTQADKKGRKWDESEFFERGRIEIDGVLKRVAKIAPNLSTERALDFGCGVGRLTRALAARFKGVCGVDISETMVKLAQQYNQQFKNCSFYLNTKPDLSLFPSESFSFIYSSIVLQHIPPAYSKNYIREFIRVLAHNGLAVFQLPSERTAKPTLRAALGLRRAKLASRFRRAKPLGRPVMEMNGIPREEVIKIVETAGGLVAVVDENSYAGRGWRSFSYYVSKN